MRSSPAGNMRTCIYVAGILGLAITVTQTGIGGAVGNAPLQVMPLDKDNRSPASWRSPELPAR